MSPKWKAIGVQWPAQHYEILAGEAAEYGVSPAAFLRLLAENYLGLETRKRKPLARAALKMKDKLWSRVQMGRE